MSNPTIGSAQTAAGFWQFSGSTARMRIFPSEDFWSLDGVYVPGGLVPDKTSCCLSLPLVVNADLSLSIPSTNKLPFTPANSSVTYTAVLYDANDVERNHYLDDFTLPEILGSSFTWYAVEIYNAQQALNPVFYPVTLYPTSALMYQAIADAIGTLNNASASIKGRTFLDVDPAVSTSPIAVGVNSPLLPTSGQLQALVGTSGSPSSSNKYVTASSFGATINVRDYATAGAGTSVSPWTGWDTAITWSPYTTYTFSDGYFGYSTSPQWGRCGIALLCGKNTYLKFTGSGVGFDFTARDTPAGFSFAITQAARIGPFRLVGNSGMTVGFDISGVQQCIFEDFRVKSVSQTAIKIRFSISCIYLMPRFSVNEEGTGHGTPVPVNGILLDNRSGGAEPCQDNTFIGTVAEGTTGYGIQLQGNCWLNTFIGGTSEANGGGISVGQLCKQNSFKGFDLEANTAYDVLNNGENSVFENLLCASSTGVVFDSFSKNSVWRDGQFQTATVNANAQDTLFDGVMGINVITSGGGITDNGTNTAIQGFLHDLQSVGAGTYYGGGFNAWRTPTLLNSWANVGGTNAVAQYVKDAIGWVSIRGCISGGSTGVVVFTLPVGFRPAKDERFAVVTDTGYGSLSVSSSGDIVLVSGGTTSFVFMEARFRTV